MFWQILSFRLFHHIFNNQFYQWGNFTIAVIVVEISCVTVCVCVELRIVKGRFVFPIFAAAPCFSISSFKSLWPHASFSFLKTFLNTAITKGIWIIGQAYFQELQQWQYNNGLRTTQYLTSTGSACPVALGHRGCIRAGDAQSTSLGSPGQVLPLSQIHQHELYQQWLSSTSIP